MIPIEKDIPIPKIQQPGKWRSIFKRLEVGDSFLVPRGWNVNSSRTSARLVGIKIQRRLDQKTKRYRIWRVG